ncbi:hypothetical protein T484DRAFT_1769289 [Baffinella frigidus]|nr:hypothetical protein T484DRAFT_1769289 [Cryptophyta sp. CCMP2293]
MQLWLGGGGEQLECEGELFSSLEQSQGPAAGGQSITLHGVALDPAGAYSLTFTDIASQRAMEVGMAFLSDTALSGVLPPWPYQAAATAVSLIRNGTEVPKDGSGTYFYNIFASVSAVSPTAAQATGGSTLTVIGGGFQRGSSGYSCSFSCDGLTLGVSAVAVSSTAVTCEAPHR